MPEKYDVIIIGAGIGGLTAGAVLSKKGKKVLVLERIHVPGGCAVNFRRGRFEFDASLHLLNGLDKGKPSYRLLEECGIDKKVKFLKPAHLYRSIFPDFDIRVPQCNSEAYINILGNLFSKEKNRIKELFRLMIRIYNRVWDTSGDKIPPADYINYVGRTCQEVFDSFGISKEAIAVIMQLWPFLGLPPKQLSFLPFVSSFCDYTYHGGYYPKGGAQVISNALVEVINDNGGVVIFSNAVKKILIKDNHAYGVTAKDGRDYLSNVIVSNVNPHATFYGLIGEKHLPDVFLEKMAKMDPSISGFIVYLGLNTNPRDFGVTDYTVFLNQGYDLNVQYKACLENDMNKIPIEISFHNLLEGNENSSRGYTMNIATVVGFNFWESFSRNEYIEKKKEMADILIKRAEAVFPNLTSYIEKIEIATPRTIVKFTENYKGAIYGWSQIISQTGRKRMKQETPIQNFYLSSAWTEPAGGVTGVMQSGVMVSNRILQNNGFAFEGNNACVALEEVE